MFMSKFLERNSSAKKQPIHATGVRPDSGCKLSRGGGAGPSLGTLELTRAEAHLGSAAMMWLCKLSTAGLWYALSLSSEHSALHDTQTVHHATNCSLACELPPKCCMCVLGRAAAWDACMGLKYGKGGNERAHMSGRLLKTVTRDWRTSLSASCAEQPSALAASSPSLCSCLSRRPAGRQEDDALYPLYSQSLTTPASGTHLSHRAGCGV
jgi:hypothetical protein